ncbi:MAG: hypothetical protein GTO18_17115 [Anaerolineales bacterium]|nr:hypothetical protein [Anaerolineales bacterium]
MEHQIPEHRMKVSALIDEAKVDEKIQEDLRSGDKQRVIDAISTVGLTEDDLPLIYEDLEVINAIVPVVSFWRFGAET